MRLWIFTILIFNISVANAANSKSKISLPAVLKADQIDGDQNSNILNAIGNVELNKNENTLFADQLSYNKDSQQINAVGNIKIKNYSIGNILAQSADVKSDFKSGNFNDATIVFNDGSYIKSPLISRIDEFHTVFKTPIFSICPNDEIKGDNILAGQNLDVISITSNQTVIDKSTDSIKTKGGVIRIYSYPVFYAPYLKTPIPSSKRKSGFLHMSYLRISKLGSGLVIPYYFNLAPDRDLTTTLKIYPDGGHLILNNEYRQLLQGGSYKVNLEIANNEPKNNSLVGTKESDQDFRWHLKSDGEIKLSKDFGLDFKIDNLGDKNYLRDYNNDFAGYTTSEINLDYIKDRDYGQIKTVKIQELEVNIDSSQSPTALPIFNYYTESKPQKNWLNETYSFLTNATIITRKNGLQYRRLSAKPEIKIPYNLNGNLFEFSSNIQGDLYNLENNFANNANSATGNNFNSIATNYRPEANLKWSLPMVSKRQENTIILEPLVTMTISSFKSGGNEIPNEDSSNTELTQNNLFLSDRLTGFDRSESGKRISYGFKSSLFNKLGEFDLGLGQSFRQEEKTQDVIIRGFNDNNKSNIVGALGYSAPKVFSILYNFQLNESSYRNDVNEINTNLDLGRVKINSNYIFIRKAATNIEKRKQLDLGFTADLSRNFFFNATSTRNLINNRIIASRYGINYKGCCVTYGISIGQNNPTDLAKAEQSLNFIFTIKNL